jgi:hypothetical protein
MTWFARRFHDPNLRGHRTCQELVTSGSHASLKGRRPRGRRLKLALVFHAVGRPGNGFEPLWLDGFAIDDATSERAILDSLQRLVDLLQQMLGTLVGTTRAGCRPRP